MSDARARLTISDADRARIEAIDRIVAVGPASIPALLAQLADPSWAVRRAVTAGLASLGDAAADQLVSVLRGDRRNEARLAAAVDSLVASTGHATEVVEPLVQDKNPAVVADAAQILGRRRSARSLPLLVRLLDHADDNVAVAAIEALGRFGGRAAVDALATAVGSGKFFRVFPAIDVLGRSGDPRAVAPLAALLGSSEYVQEATRALGRTGDRAAVAPLTRLLSSASDSHVRLGALALADLLRRYRERYGNTTGVDEAFAQADPGEAAIRRLNQTLGDADASEQPAICQVLGVIGGAAAIPALTRMLDSPTAAREATSALKRIGRRDSDASIVEALRAGDSARRQVLLPAISSAASVDDVAVCLTDPDPIVRALACDTLARLANARVVPALFARLEDPNPRVVQSAIAAIQTLGGVEAETFGLQAARSPVANVRRAALRVLSYFGFSSALGVFLEALKDPDPRVRDGAIQGLPFIEDPRALEILLEVARDPQDRARATAMRALGQCPLDVRVTSYLLKGLADPDAWVRYYACQSLGKLAVEPAAQPIAALLGDPAGQVRVAAVEALSHLKSPTALVALEAAARAPEPDVQRAALIGLGIAQHLASLPILVAAATSADAATRLVALSSLASFTPSLILPVLARAAFDPDESVRTAAVGFLASTPSIEATKFLIDSLGNDAGSHDRILAALATPAEDRVAGVLTALEVADDERAPDLTSVLARLNRVDATAALFQAATLPNVAARKAAVTTLAALGTREALSALETASRMDPDSEVRRICLLLLAQ